MNRGAEVIETHISYVFLIGDRAYKLKKPIKTPFLDYSSREARLWACEREVELNRRLSPDVYLGVASILDEHGQPCDSLVVMRRMPSERSLSRLVRARADVADDVRKIARLMAGFHSLAPRSAAISTAAGIESVRANWEANFAEMRGSVGRVLDAAVAGRVELLVRRYLSGRTSLFTDRVEGGMARDGHGDLKADDIFCLEDGPRILDCIEFDDRFRHGDVLDDVAFLAMDLERLGSPPLARAFLSSYAEFSAESHPESLLHHYIAYRAHVRAKVACIREDQGDPSAGAEARQLLGICLQHLEEARVRLILVGGLPAAGKSTLASKLADRLGYDLVRSDEVRKELAGLAHDSPAAAPAGEGLYRRQLVEGAYDEMFRRARLALERGVSVILDATWRDAQMREAARLLAQATCADLVEIGCTAPRSVLQRRLARRKGRVAASSDATLEVLDWMKFDQWPGSVDVDTSVAPSESLAAAMELVTSGHSARSAAAARP
ncbi:MAG TPA: AAA family ATPase [Candidatus Baltobacterales bacterium]|nr:AAA family ATPase [Candidatus Baltobacterales bacterium]